jgi:hypothetical protein
MGPEKEEVTRMKNQNMLDAVLIVFNVAIGAILLLGMTNLTVI